MIVHEQRPYCFHEIPFLLHKAAFRAETFQNYIVDAPHHQWHPFISVIVPVPQHERFLNVANYLSNFEDVL